MKRLLILLSSLYLFSCATKQQVQVTEKEVIVKCPVPDIPQTERPTIKPDQSTTEKLQSLLNYLFQLERENELIREVIEICRQ